MSVRKFDKSIHVNTDTTDYDRERQARHINGSFFSPSFFVDCEVQQDPLQDPNMLRGLVNGVKFLLHRQLSACTSQFFISSQLS